MSATVSIIWFLMGSGLMILGAFFLWQWVARCGNALWAVVAAVMPVGMAVIVAAVCRQSELVVGMVWGTVAVNLGLMGVLNLIARVRPNKVFGLMSMLWVAFGWSACLVAGRNGGNLGMFTGWGLVVVGLIAIWWWLRQASDKTINENQSALANQTAPRLWWHWLWLVVAMIAVCVGAGIMVGRHAVISAVLGVPESVFGAVVMAPLLAVATLTGLRPKQQWQSAKIVHGCLGGSVLLATLGFGLAAVLAGGLRLTQSTVAVTLPWVAGMAVLSVVVWRMPTKTARWCGGLIAVMYLAYLVSLFW